MASNSPLDEWKFLIGTWKGKTEGGQFGIKGTIEGVGVFSCEPGDMFIMATGENRCEGQLLHKSISILFYDNVARNLNGRHSSRMGSFTMKWNAQEPRMR